MLPAAAYSQTAQQDKPKERKVSVGFRARILPTDTLSVMDTKTTMSTTFAPVYDWQFVTTSRSSKWGVGPAVEVVLSPRLTLSTEVMFNRLKYDKVTTTLSGGDDPNTGNDERSRTTRTENTKARLWDVPVMLHYSVASSGPWSRMYVAAGGAYRTVSTIRTSNKLVLPNGETSTDSKAASPSHRGIYGATIGLGFRFIDDFNIKSTPEIRYTRWAARTFDLDSTRSPVNQLEIGIGFTF